MHSSSSLSRELHGQHALSSLTFCFPALAFLFFVFSLIFDIFSGYWRAFFERGSCALGEAPALKSFVKGASLIQIDLSISVSSILLPVIFKFFRIIASVKMFHTVIDTLRDMRELYIHTYILYWLVPTGLFRVNFTLQNYKPSTWQ